MVNWDGKMLKHHAEIAVLTLTSENALSTQGAEQRITCLHMAHGRHAGSVIFKIGDWEGLAITCCGSVTPLTSKMVILL